MDLRKSSGGDARPFCRVRPRGDIQRGIRDTKLFYETGPFTHTAKDRFALGDSTRLRLAGKNSACEAGDRLSSDRR
jgi:hypothetical protein